MLYKGTLGGLWYPVRRDCPEIILPDGATATTITPALMAAGHTDTFSAYAEMCSTTEFGSIPLSLIGINVTFRTGLTLSASDTQRISRQILIELASGSAGSETTIGEFRLGSGAFVQLTISSGASTALAMAQTAIYLETPPLLIPASTRLSVRNQYNDTSTIGSNATYGIAYDPTKLVFSNNPSINWDHFLKGGMTLPHDTTDLTSITSGSPSASNGSYVTLNINGGATLDADYLVWGFGSSQDFIGNSVHQTYDIALGTAGNEVVQARGCLGGTVFGAATGEYKFKYPFIAYKGETLRARLRATGASLDHLIWVGMIRLGVT